MFDLEASCEADFAALTAALMLKEAGAAEQQARSLRYICLHKHMLQDMLTV